MATATAIQDLFAYRNISAAVEKVKEGIPEQFPPEFASLTEPVIGNETTYTTFYGQRKIVQRTEYAGPAKIYNQNKIGQKAIVMPSFNGKIQIEQELILRLRQPNDLMAQDRARDFIARAAAQFGTRWKNNRIAHYVAMLNLGIYYYDVNGNFLTSSSGATVTVDMGTPAGNRNQIGGIIDAAWSATGTNIYNHIVKLKQKAIQTTGRPLEHAFYGINIPGYIYKNDSFKYYFQFNPTYFQAFANSPGVIPNGFMDLQWHPMFESFYDNESSAVQQLWTNDDQVTFTPEISRDVYTLFEGSVAVPTRLGIGPNVDYALESCEVKYGQYGFCKFDVESAMSAWLTFGDNFLPTWKSENDIYYVDTTP